MTASQIARIAGFNASLNTRGVSVSLEGASLKLVALVEDRGVEFDGFEVGQIDTQPTKIHVLNTDLGTAAINHGDILKEDESGRRHRVLRRESYDIKTVFVCTLE